MTIDRDSRYWEQHQVGRRRFLRGTAAGALGLSALAILGCGDSDDPASAPPSNGTGASTDSGEPRPGGTLRIAYFQDDATSLSPMANGGQAAANVQFTAHADHYVYGGADGSVTPMLWEEYEWIEPTQLRARLRAGLTFQDGTPLDGEAVQWHLETLSDPERSPRFTTLRGLIALVESVDVTSDTEVLINLSEPDFGFVSNLVLTPGAPFSRTQVETLGEGEFSLPRFAGPYTPEEPQAGVGWKSRKFDGYWGGLPGMEPWLDELDWRFILSNETRGAALESGEVDAAAWREADNTAKRLLEDSRMQGVTFDRSPHGLTINHVAPPLDDLRVRQAVAHAIDRDRVREAIFAGLGEPSESLIVPGVTGWKASDPYQYDPEKARQLLDAAGVADPRLVMALVGSPPPEIRRAQGALYQQMLESVGFTVEVQNVTNLFTDLGEDVPFVSPGDFGQRFDAFASWTLRASYAGNNTFHSTNAEDKPIQDQLDKLIFEGRSTDDPERRIELLHEISDLYHSNVMGTIPVTRTVGALIARENVGGMDNPEIGAPLGWSRPRLLWLRD